MIKLDPKILNTTADEIMRIDGDRDDMNRSDLICEQTRAIANFLRKLARSLEEA